MSKVTILTKPNRIVIASKGVQGPPGPGGEQGIQGPKGDTGDVTPEAIAARDAAQEAAEAAAQSAADTASALGPLAARVTELEENPAFPDAPDDGGAYIRVNGQWVQLYAPLALAGDLPDGTVDESYSATLTASGGRPPYALGDVLLPPGLGATLSDATVTVAGTPSEEWQGEANIDLSDSLGTAIRRVLDVRVDAVPHTLLLVVAGQSNGARRAPKVTTTYDARLKTFSGGNETTDRVDGQPVTAPFPTGWFNSLSAFSEFGKDEESYAPGFAAAAPEQVASIITSTTAVGARHWRELGPGTGPWANMGNALRIGNDLAVSGGETNVRNLLVIDHGESDADAVPPGGSGSEGPITSLQYATILDRWTVGAKRRVKLAQANPNADITVLGVQPCITAGEGWRNMQNGHVAAALGASGYCLAGPRYAYAYETDATHMAGLGRRLFGEYLAHRYADVQAGRALPVLIQSGSRSDAVITLNYNTIEGDLVIDTTAVPETTTSYPNSRYGFECFKVSDGTVLAISAVAVAGKAVTITLASNPGGPVRVRYAQQTYPGGSQSVIGPTSKLNRGNIRDSGGHVALYDGSTLRNWACHQSIEVT